MIESTEGSILSLKEGIIVQGCNCQGVMGSGIAKSIRDQWSDVYSAYRKVYVNSGLKLGDIVTVAGNAWATDAAVARHVNLLSEQLPSRLIVVNAMTQDKYGGDPNTVYVDYDGLGAAFAQIRVLARDTKLTVHFPLIGCGLANGKWEEVSARIEQMLGPDISKKLWLLPNK